MPKDRCKTRKPASAAADTPLEPSAQVSDLPRRPKKDLLVVGIGASAGGLQAIIDLLKNLSFDNIAAIVVQHLAPEHDSMLTKILGRNCSGQVVTVEEGVQVEAGFVYVLPPNKDVRIEAGQLHLKPRLDAAGLHLPVDSFFASLGHDQGASAAGVVLSGTGKDGTRGLEALKEEGGITFVQRPESAAHEGMPQSALNGGNADFSLTPKDIAAELVRISHRPHHARDAIKQDSAAVAHYHEQLFGIVRQRFGTNLALYKLATVERRLARRLTLCKIDDLRHYVEYVRNNDHEKDKLHREMLISVTRFFRVPVVFAALQARLRERWPTRANVDAAPLRVWVPACATGEEAYSLAILILEEAERSGLHRSVQIFATDIDEHAIGIARRGIYGVHIQQEMSQERLDRHFSQRDNGYMVSSRLRDMIVFSRQDILLDPPFPRIDLVSCRNLLIYFKPSAQQQCLHAIHYAMKDDGWLVLGTSEGVGELEDLFSPLDTKHKIYAKRMTHGMTSFSHRALRGSPKSPHSPPSQQEVKGLTELADCAILQTYLYPGAIVDEDLRVLHFRGDTGPFFSPTPGTATLSILKLVRSELRIELSQALKKSRARQKRVTTYLTITEKHSHRRVALDVVPLRDAHGSRFLLILFHQSLKHIPPTREAKHSVRTQSERVAQLRLQVEQLEKKLSASHEYLQSTIEEKESANEELKSSAEEMQSANEELQSANEELETSREEMQSANEELTTVNEELQNRIAQLAEANDDLHNVMAGVDNPVFIISLDLTIRRLTQAAKALFGYGDDDIGRSVRVLESFTGDCDLVGGVSRVIQTLSIIENEIMGANRRWYLLRIVPYKTTGHSIRGAIISLIDQDVQKRSKQSDVDVAHYAQKYLTHQTHPHVILDKSTRCVFASESFYSAFQVAPEETVGATFAGHISGNLSDAVLHGWLAETMRTGKPFSDRDLQCQLPDVGLVNAQICAECIDIAPHAQMLLVTIKLAQQ